MKARTRRSRFQFLPLGIHVIAGAVGVLAGLHYLLSQKDQATKDQAKQPATPEASQPAPVEPIQLPKERQNYFAIRRTKSEVGYVYWVLQGYGEFRCYLLCDSWREAMDEASLRIQNCGERAAASEEALAATA